VCSRGLVFSATLVRRPAARALLLLLAAPLALGMNVVRSLTLTLLANAGTDISGAWHDWTGFAVLGVTAAILAGLALLLETRAPAAAPPVAPPAYPRRWSRWLLPSGLACAATLVGVFTLSTHGPRGAPDLTRAPDLARLVPEKFSDWEHVTTDDLRRLTPTLETDKLIQRTYQRRTADGVEQITLYVAWWAPGQVPVSLVQSHTPESCWPGSGWVQQPAPRTEALTVAGRALPAPIHLFFKDGAGFPQHTWYWHLNAGRPVLQINPLSPCELLALAWQHGFITSGEQLFVRVSSNRPWDRLAAEPLLTEFFAALAPLGL
jgi:exosortase/archaeosortase family protein